MIRVCHLLISVDSVIPGDSAPLKRNVSQVYSFDPRANIEERPNLVDDRFTEEDVDQVSPCNLC